MTNKEIARNFNELARIMELHDENPFKIRSYANAYLQLRKVGTPLVDMSDAEISGIKGVGKAIAGKIRELERTGTLAALEKYREMTPQGVQDMLRIKGFGPKKIKSLWKGLEGLQKLIADEQSAPLAEVIAEDVETARLLMIDELTAADLA